MSFTPYDRPVRAAFVGLGRIYDLNVRAYLGNPDVEVVALVDPTRSGARNVSATGPRPPSSPRRPSSRPAVSRSTRSRRCCPTPLHADGVVELLGHGWHVNLQKPMCNDLDEAKRMLDAAEANDRVLRVMENYIFYEPLMKLKEIVHSGRPRRGHAATT